MGEPFRCSAASRERGDQLAGTASTVRAFLLVEHPGAWGVDALRDARLPDGLGARLAAEGRRTGVRVLLVRRPGRSSGGGGVRVFAARAAGGASSLGTALLGRVDEVGDLDLAAVAAGSPAGLERHDRPVLAVCTHGRHDACCAERGRPLAAALAADPDHAADTWECSHIGGDRFAGNLLVLPQGLYYGGLDVPDALAVARATGEGRLVLDRLRGRSSLPMPLQAAEIALRRSLDEIRLDALAALDHRRDGDLVTARFAVGEDEYVVRLRAATPEPHRLTCRADRASPVPRWDLVDIENL